MNQWNRTQLVRRLVKSMKEIRYNASILNVCGDKDDVQSELEWASTHREAIALLEAEWGVKVDQSTVTVAVR